MGSESISSSSRNERVTACSIFRLSNRRLTAAEATTIAYDQWPQGSGKRNGFRQSDVTGTRVM